MSKSNHFQSTLKAVLVASLFLMGCGVSDPKNPNFIVAKGAGVKVTRAELDDGTVRYLTQQGAPVGQKLPPEMMQRVESRVLENLITRKLLVREGSTLKIPDLDKQVDEQITKIKAQYSAPGAFEEVLKKVNATPEKMRQDLRDQIVIMELLKSKTTSLKAPPDAELKKFYDEHADSFAQPKMVKASHILIKCVKDAPADEKAKKKKAIEAARTRIVSKKEDFAKVAKEVSEDPGSAVNGGDLGFFGQGQMVPEFEKAAFGGKIGEVSPVFETAYGFHFLKVVDVHAARKIPFEEAKPQIVSYLQRRDEAGIVQEYVKTLMDKAKIEYFLTTAAPTPPPAPSPAGAPPAPPKPAAPAPSAK